MPAANTMFGGSITATAPMSGYPQTPSTQPTAVGTGASVVIDGTPTRVAAIVLLMVGGAWAFKEGGIKFNIATSN